MSEKQPPSNFIRNIIDDDLNHHHNEGRVQTRFPPEPNGYLHIGHAKSIHLNFGIARDYEGGRCNLRFDDTNPDKEAAEYAESIKNDVQWLGFDWQDCLFYTSDHYQQLYEFAKELIQKGKAYVDHLSPDEIREYRGTLTAPGKSSPYRDRTVAENLDLFERMRAGEFAEGDCLLRAKIDMSAPNINMRDPALYRIKKVSHYRTANHWCIYPMYDYAHCVSDAIEGVTHSLCTLEFEDHRPLYNWFLEHLSVPYHPKQIEFARLNIDYTITSKRKLHELVSGQHVSGWDDPRMPTIAGMRRRGYTASAIQRFCERIGVAKSDNAIDFGVLENCVREDLDLSAPRVLAVLKPLKVVIENYPADKSELLTAPYYPNNPAMGQRELPFSKVLYIEQDDFMEDPPKGFYRLTLRREVRLRYAYFITCTEVIKDAAGNIIELRCHYDPETKGGSAPDGRKVKGTIHWVCATQALQTSVRLYDRLFNVARPDARGEQDWKQFINPNSMQQINNAWLEPSLIHAKKGQFFQFERTGYFCVDQKDDCHGQPVFNRIVTLRDSWASKHKPKNNQS